MKGPTAEAHWRKSYRQMMQNELAHKKRQPNRPTASPRQSDEPRPWRREVSKGFMLSPEIKAAMLTSAANWLRIGQRVQIVSSSVTLDGSGERRVGRLGVIWTLCTIGFAEYVYVYLDPIGRERSEKIEFLEIRDLEPVDGDSAGGIPRA